MSYYKTIDGKKMDCELIDQTSLLVQGTGDGRISLMDAGTLLKLIKDGHRITDVEMDTMEYIFKNFRWNVRAEEWFRKELKTWQANHSPIPVTIADLSKKHFASVDVLSDSASRAARQHALEAATYETVQDHDEIGLWIRLNDGTTIEVFSNFIELAGEFVELRGGFIIPVRAIEKVEI